MQRKPSETLIFKKDDIASYSDYEQRHMMTLKPVTAMRKNIGLS